MVAKKVAKEAKPVEEAQPAEAISPALQALFGSYQRQIVEAAAKRAATEMELSEAVTAVKTLQQTVMSQSGEINRLNRELANTKGLKAKK